MHLYYCCLNQPSSYNFFNKNIAKLFSHHLDLDKWAQIFDSKENLININLLCYCYYLGYFKIFYFNEKVPHFIIDKLCLYQLKVNP